MHIESDYLASSNSRCVGIVSYDMGFLKKHMNQRCSFFYYTSIDKMLFAFFKLIRVSELHIVLFF